MMSHFVTINFDVDSIFLSPRRRIFHQFRRHGTIYIYIFNFIDMKLDL